MNKEVKVGALVILFLVVGLLFVVWIKGNPFRQTKVLHVLFDNVHGLSIGSPVEYAGYQCGKVKDFKVTPSGILSEILITDPKVKIHQGDKFLIIPSSTIASEYQIFIVPNSRPSLEVPDKATIIGQSAPGMQDFLFKAEDALDNLTLVMSQIQTILSDVEVSVGELTPVFTKFGKLARDGTIDSVARDVSQSARSISSASTQAERLIRNNSSQIDSAVKSVSSVSGQLDRKLSVIKTEDLNEIIQGMKTSVTNIRDITGAVEPAEVKRDLKVFTDTAEQAKEIMSKLQSTNPDEDAPTLVKRSVQRIDRISEGLEKSLKHKTLFRVLTTRVPIRDSSSSGKIDKQNLFKVNPTNNKPIPPEIKQEELKNVE
jgi:ABC-type transporter Mla subunit MlaD